GKDAGNYELQKDKCQVETTADIYYAEVTITADKQEKTYGDADPTLTAVVTGLVEGESEDLIKYKLTRENGTNVGEYEIKCDYEFFQGNYIVSYVKNYLTITQKEATVKAENKTKAFGEADPELTAKVTGTINGETLSYTLTRDWVGTEDGEKVGSYYIRATGDEYQTNYHVTFENGVLTIDPKDVTVTADDITITFGDEAPTYTAKSNVDGFDAYTVSCDYKQGDNAGTYKIKVESTDTSGNYNVTTQNGTLTVKPMDVTVTAKDATITYGGDAPQYEATASVDGFTAYEVNCAYTKGDNIGTYDITVTSTDTTGNYNVTVENATLTVNPAKVTITPKDAEKVYNGAEPTLQATVDGLVNNDSESVIKYKLSREQGKNVGTYKISVEADAEQGNYVVKCETGTFTINPKQVNIVVDNKAKEFGQPDPELTSTAYGLVAGEQITYTLEREAGEQVGEYAIEAKIQDVEQGNYIISGFTPGKLTINEKAATITAKDEQITYGDKLPDFTATVEGTLNGDTLTYTVKAVYEDSDLSSSGNLKVGEYPIVVECETTQGNYAVGTTAGKLTVAPKTVTFDGITASDKVYDGTVDAELSVENAKFNGLIDGDDFKVVDAKGEFEDKDAGLKKNVEIETVVIDGTDAENYKVDVLNSQYRTKASITRKAVKVTPADNQKIYGDKDPFINVTVEGILDGDTIVYSRTRDEGEDVGKYTIRTDGVEQQGNYQVEFGTATFTITKREVTVSGITAKNKTYDGTTKATLVFDGVKFGNIVKGDELGVTAKGVFASKNVGTRQVDISNLKLTGSSAKNYVLAKDGNQTSTTAKITKATLTVTAKDKTIKFGSAPKNAGVTYDGFVNGETKSVLTGKLAYDYGGYEKGSYAGTYKITPSGLKSSNYKIKYKKGKLIVTAPKTVGDSYIVHARDLGDMAAASNGGIAGTTGEGRRIEAVGLSLSLDNQPYAGGIEYRSHLRDIDWLKSWQRDGEFSGTKGEGRRLEAVQIRLYGKMAKYYDVYYRLHVRNYGWMGWAKNGAKAGTVHENRRAEAIQVVVLKKGSKAPGANYKGASTTFAAAFTTGNPIL
ncbi:MAG: MBG domain-containing protein, partial [Coriobacteriales bacterium]|nr:MBG domain-containing protein [Coriobacteriales bacterium]